jgi:hypothetical protein
VNCIETSSGSSDPYVWPYLVLAVIVVAPLVMATYLYRTAGRRAAIA